MQLWLGGAAALMTGCLLASLSRAGILGAAIGLLAFVAVSRSRNRVGGGAVWLLAALAATPAPSTMSNLGTLALRLRETTEQGPWGRPAIWRDTWRMARDFPLTGVGAGAFQRGMLAYQRGSRLFFFNHAHDEYLQLVAEGGLLLCVPAAAALGSAIVLIAMRLRRDRTPIYWIRLGAASGMMAIAVQSFWDTGLRTPANGILFAVIAAMALHHRGAPPVVLPARAASRLAPPHRGDIREPASTTRRSRVLDRDPIPAGCAGRTASRTGTSNISAACNPTIGSQCRAAVRRSPGTTERRTPAASAAGCSRCGR